MGNCFRSHIRIINRSTSSKNATATADDSKSPKPNAAVLKTNQTPRNNDKRLHEKKSTNSVPYGLKTDFGYFKDFDKNYAIGKLLGHGQFGYTFIATNKSTHESVAVKRIEKKKVINITGPSLSTNRYSICPLYTLKY